MTVRGDHIDELISASLTGGLTDAERAELEAHLTRCETCRETLAASPQSDASSPACRSPMHPATSQHVSGQGSRTHDPDGHGGDDRAA